MNPTIVHAPSGTTVAIHHVADRRRIRKMYRKMRGIGISSWAARAAILTLLMIGSDAEWGELSSLEAAERGAS